MPSSPEASGQVPAADNRTKHISIRAIALLTVVAVGLTMVSVYSIRHAAANELARQNDTLASQIASLQKQIKRQDDINKGIVTVNRTYSDPAGQLGMLDGSVTFAMPKGWSRVPATRCAEGTRDSEVLCYDVANIAPSSFIDNTGKSLWAVQVAIFKYNNSDGSAKNWFETKYYDTRLDQFSPSGVANLKTDAINGDSAFSFQIVSGPATHPDYVRAYYVIVHGKYAVLASADLQYGATYGTYPGAKPYDYRNSYEPVLQHFIQSVRFE